MLTRFAASSGGRTCVMKPVSGEWTGLERPCKAGEGAWPHLKGNQSSWGICSKRFWEDRVIPARCSFLIPLPTTPPGNRWLDQREPIHRQPNALWPIRCSLKKSEPRRVWLSQETSQLNEELRMKVHKNLLWPPRTCVDFCAFPCGCSACLWARL